MIPNSPIFRKVARLEPYLLPAIVVLVALGAFGLGRLSATQEQSLRVLYPGVPAATPLSSTAAVAAAKAQPLDSARGGGTYVASKNGTKYYLVTCSSSNRIKAENRVYFGSIQEAVAAGYEPAANCPGI
ncbi:MAG: hypothetical protein KA066_02370 [Candidatus Pacebacteria bacterium]|nr:hypothetical protein [Candidatus Paceibacterota bacterium]